ncbi:MAG TPA: nucleotidyltransferase domain-containing protein [Coriobacteriaceae bacterium]|nr:nucleotidyltransferase domain-containing protein [Coriobacteriaceae bacterium]
MTAKVYSIDEIRLMIEPLLLKYNMASASLFGSYARGNADESSDIDVLLVGNDGFKALGIFGLAEELHRMSGKQVDVYELSELDPGSFRDTVLREAVAL